MDKNVAIEQVKKQIPSNAKILNTVDYKGHYIFAIDDPANPYDNFLAVDKNNGSIKRFNPYADLKFFAVASKQLGE